MSRSRTPETLPITLAEEPTALATFDAKDHRGKETIGRGDVTLPRIAVAQKTSPQLEPDKTDYIEGLKLYELYNSLTKEKYGNGPLDFVVVRMDKRAIAFDMNNTVVDFNVPLDDLRLQFTIDADGHKQKPEATLFYDYIIVLTESRMPAVLSLKGTGIKVAKKMNAFIQLAPGPAWAVKYRLTSSKGTAGSFSYGVYAIAPAGRADAEIMALADQMYEQLRGAQVNTDRAPLEDEEAAQESIPF